jgi:hypothetical protein
MQFSKLLWNELDLALVRCDIYQGKYDRNEGESMTEHYVRYASLEGELAATFDWVWFSDSINLSFFYGNSTRHACRKSKVVPWGTGILMENVVIGEFTGIL